MPTPTGAAASPSSRTRAVTPSERALSPAAATGASPRAAVLPWACPTGPPGVPAGRASGQLVVQDQSGPTVLVLDRHAAAQPGQLAGARARHDDARGVPAALDDGAVLQD